MKKILLIGLLPLIIMGGCKKEEEKPCPEVSANVPPSEVTNLRAYIQSNNITAQEDSRGFFYRIEAAGGGAKPNPCSNLRVDYSGRLTTGGEFDKGTNVAFSLSGLITGWRMGLPLIGAGGRIILYLPPSLGYGNTTAGTIPPNSILIFTIDLKSVD